jgi:LysM repeat protein
MAASSPPRLLAPLALAAAVLAVIVVVATSGGETTSPELPRAPATTRPATPARPRASSYVVKPGDNLTVIAEKTGVEIETLERLNPDLDPQALQAGARIKLAR